MTMKHVFWGSCPAPNEMDMRLVLSGFWRSKAGSSYNIFIIYINFNIKLKLSYGV